MGDRMDGRCAQWFSIKGGRSCGRPGEYGTADDRRKSFCYLMNGIKTVKKGSAAGTSGRMLTDERIPLPEGIVAPTYLYDGPLNHFNDPKEVMGFEDTVSVTIPVESMEHHYYSMLRKIERLAKNRMSAGSDENRTHYRLLVYKISQSLK